MSKPVILLDQGEFVGLSGATSGDVLTWNGTAWVSSPNGNGTVTSITAGAGLAGGTITTSGTISMPNVGTAASYGSASSVPVFTTDAQGRVSAVTDTSIGISTAQVTGLDTALAGKALKTTTVSAGTGLSGGGDLSVNRTISMPNVGTASSYGSSSSVPVITTDAQGRVSSVTPTAIAIEQSQVSDLVDDLAGKASTSTQVIAGTGLSGGGALSGDVTLSLPNVGAQGEYGSASSVAVVTTDAQGRVSSATTTAIAITQSQVADLVTDLGNKADKSVTATAGTGLAGGGTLASNFSFSLDTVGTEQTDQGSSSKTVTLSTDAYGRVIALSEQSIGSLPASAISSGQLALVQGGTGIDASSVSAGQLLVGGTGALALQSISQDGSLASDGKLTVTGLQTNPVSATVLGAPDAGKALVWSGTEWQASTIQGGGGGGGLVYFMNYGASSPYPLSTIFDQHAGWDTGAITVANDGNGTVLGTFVTAVGVPGIEVIPAGLWDVNFYAQASANNNSTAVRFKVATLAGVTQTVIATSDWVYISDPAVVNNYIATVYVPLTDVALTDRIKIILEGRRFTSASQTITTHFGTDSITHSHTTINAPGGTGLVKVVDGFLQTPATLLVNADIDAAAAIAVAKLAAGTDTYVLTTVSGVPTWSPSAGGGVLSVAGTAGQVLVGGTTGLPQTGALTLTLPQSIASTSSPTFAGLTLDAFSGLLRATTGVLSSGASVSLTGEVTGTLPILNGGTNLTSSGASGNLLVSDGSAWASVPMTGDATIASTGAVALKNTGSAGTYGSASAVPVFATDAQGRVTSATNTPIDFASNAVTSLTGTPNQVIASASTGAITLSLPQSINTSSTPTFASLTLGGTLSFSTLAYLKPASDNAIRLQPNTGNNTSLIGETRSSGAAASITVQGGLASGTVTTGGALQLYGGSASSTTGSGGNVSIEGGTPNVGGTAGQVNIGTRTVGPLSSAITIGHTGITTTINGTLNLANALGVAYGGTGVSSLTSNALLVGGSTVGGLSGSASGQFVRWNATSGVWAATALTGTTNQVTVTSTATTTTLSLPQSIALTSSPTFAGVTVGNIYSTSDLYLNPSTGNVILSSSTATQSIAPSTASTGKNLSISGGYANGEDQKGGTLTLSAGFTTTATNASGGDTLIYAASGVGTGTTGYIGIGEYYTSSVKIGASGITTTINGTLKLANLNATADTITLAATTGAGLLKLTSASLLTIQPATSTLGSSYTVSLIGGDNNYALAGGTGGTANVTGGAATGLNGNGGNVNIEGGANTGTGAGGIVWVGNSANTSALRIGRSTNSTILAGAVNFANYIDNSNLYLYGPLPVLAPYAKNDALGSNAFTVRGENNSAGNGGPLNIVGGATTKSGATGGYVSIEGGAGATAGQVLIGTGTSTESVIIGRPTAYINLSGPVLSSSSITATAFYWKVSTSIKYLAPIASNLVGSPPGVAIQGESNTVGRGGAIYLQGGETTANAPAGNVYINGGAATSGGLATGGDVFITGGIGSSQSNGGGVSIGGTGQSVSIYGGSVSITGTGTYSSSVSITGNTTMSGGSALTLTSALTATNGGTGQSSYTTGDLLYASATNTLSKRAAGTNGYVLTMVSGVPAWAASSGGGGVTSLQGTANQVLVGGTSGSPQTGALTLTLPQSIGTGSSPTFAQMTLTGLYAGISLQADVTQTITKSSSVGGTTLSIKGDLGSSAGEGGIVEISGGQTRSTGTVGGALLLSGGDGGDANQKGGAVSISGGSGGLTGTGQGGSVNIGGGLGAQNGSVLIGTGFTSAVTIGESGITTTINGTLALATALGTQYGGTGAAGTLTGYVKAAGTGAMTASAAIPVSDVTGAAPLASPTFTGTVTLPLTTAGYVKTTLGGVISSSSTVSTGDLSGQVSLANGGTNASLTASNGQVAYSTATELALTSGGSTGQVLRFNSGSAPTWEDVTVPAQPYDLRGRFVGTPASGVILDAFIADRSATISTTSTGHKFSAKTLPSAGSVVLTVQRTRTGSTVTVFTATSASTDTVLNGYYPMTVSSVANNDLLADDVVEVVMQAGAVNASFSTPVWTISATA